MHRQALLDLLDTYQERYPGELETTDRIRRFVLAHHDCFERTCLQGHVTGSAWVLSADMGAVLLTHHAKLDRWLQLGGHSDGDPDSFQVALREAREESGLEELGDPAGDLHPVPFDLDVHEIPARGSEPAHFHFDVRYLLVAGPDQVETASAESHEIRWVPIDDVRNLTDEVSLLRMVAKTGEFLRSIGSSRSS